FQTDRLVSPAGLHRIARVRITKRTGFRIGSQLFECVVLFLRARLAAGAHESLAPDPAWSKYGNVLEVLAPDQTVVPVTMTEVLILVPRVWLLRIVLTIAVVRTGGEDGCALIDIKCNVALQADGKSAIGSSSKQNCPTARCSRRIDCFIN